MLIPEEIEKIPTIYGSFFSRKGDKITNNLKQYSAQTRNELAMIKALVKDEDNVLDIGAHIGTFSMPFAIFNGGRGKVFSFEANPDNFELLRRNISENNLDGIVIPTHALVSSKNQAFEMSLPNGGNSGMYYFMPNSNISSTGIDIINIDRWYKNLESEIKIKLIKVDVEGAEALVLRSCQELIKKFKPILFIEISKSHLNRFGNSVSDIEEILKPCGYHYFRNIGRRNSNNDIFKIVRLKSVNEGGKFFDLLAVHESDPRYPKKYLGSFSLWVFQKKSSLIILLKRFKPLKPIKRLAKRLFILLDRRW